MTGTNENAASGRPIRGHYRRLLGYINPVRLQLDIKFDMQQPTPNLIDDEDDLLLQLLVQQQQIIVMQILDELEASDDEKTTPSNSFL